SGRCHCVYCRAVRRYAGGRAVSPLALDIDKDRKRMTALSDPWHHANFRVGLDILFARRARAVDRERYRLALRFDCRRSVGLTARCRSRLPARWPADRREGRTPGLGRWGFVAGDWPVGYRHCVEPPLVSY